MKLRAHFANADLALFPNQFVTTTLLVDVLRDATIVPTAAIQRGAPGTFVYVVSPQRTVSVRPVTLGPTDGERVAIQSGLTPGDQVVVDGADKLRDGAKVAVPIASGVEGTADGARGSVKPCSMPNGPLAYHSPTCACRYATRLAWTVGLTRSTAWSDAP